MVSNLKAHLEANTDSSVEGLALVCALWCRYCTRHVFEGSVAYKIMLDPQLEYLMQHVVQLLSFESYT